MSGAERDAADLVETMLRLDDHSPASSYHRGKSISNRREIGCCQPHRIILLLCCRSQSFLLLAAFASSKTLNKGLLQAQMMRTLHQARVSWGACPGT